MATLTSLPEELAAQVCQYLDDDDLWSLCKVSKWCAEKARPHLYEEIVLSSHRLPSFLQIIILQPQLAELVRFLRLSSFQSCIIKKEDMKFFQEHFLGTGTHAGVHWASLIADAKNLSGMLTESLLMRLVNLEQIDLFLDIDPNFTQLSSNGVSSKPKFPSSLKQIDLLGESSTGNLGALHGILAASKVEKLSAEFLGIVYGVPVDDSCYHFLRHVHLISCKLKKQELQRFLQKCSSLQSFCYIAYDDSDDFMDDVRMSRFKHSQITAKDVTEALKFNASTLQDLHIYTRCKYAPIADLQSFTSLKRLRFGHERAWSPRDLLVDDDDDSNDNINNVGPGRNPFIWKLPSSLRLLRIDNADNKVLEELNRLPTDVRGILSHLEKVELQSHDQLLLTAAMRGFQGSGIVVELVGCLNHCWNCDTGTLWMCNSCRSQPLPKFLHETLGQSISATAMAFMVSGLQQN